MTAVTERCLQCILFVACVLVVSFDLATVMAKRSLGRGQRLTVMTRGWSWTGMETDKLIALKRCSATLPTNHTRRRG